MKHYDGPAFFRKDQKQETPKKSKKQNHMHQPLLPKRETDNVPFYQNNQSASDEKAAFSEAEAHLKRRTQRAKLGGQPAITKSVASEPVSKAIFTSDAPASLGQTRDEKSVEAPQQSVDRTVESSSTASVAPATIEETADPAYSHELTFEKQQNRLETAAPASTGDHLQNGYQFPAVSLLKPPVKLDPDSQSEWLTEQVKSLDEALAAFGVTAKVVDWTVGPTVTQFQIELGRGVKVNKITNLTDDLKLQLAAKDIRIEAPIPGKSTVGIEVPNFKSRPVMLSEVLNAPVFKNSESPLTIALGVDLFGQPRVYDLRKMPHGLIAGATGSGKSVFINSLLVSILYKATPQQVRLLLIDPKTVELAPYNDLPHLLAPVISDPKAASAALKWVTNEMDERYEKLAAAGVRNIEQFNKKAETTDHAADRLPYIVVIIDELADLMMVAASEVQDYIVRITQKARAAGIHLIIATQRPSVDVVTGLIKNNIPTRVAFMVSSQIDSRTILDHSGAERLLGRGDMLFLGNGASTPIRLQGSYVDGEIDEITDFIRAESQPHYAFDPDSLKKKVEQVEEQDELMPEVLAYLAEEDTISTSKLQRVFSIGYNHAATLIDQLENHNYISEARGSKPREVYFTQTDLKKIHDKEI
ncbi:DNA translocase FtsK [Pediococcus siamensis]|uniref:DNA translocase FtsK n=1 Tax=Pediococcus siamensis TaxID=381829 RepID=UPI0039A285E1